MWREWLNRGTEWRRGWSAPSRQRVVRETHIRGVRGPRSSPGACQRPGERQRCQGCKLQNEGTKRRGNQGSSGGETNVGSPDCTSRFRPGAPLRTAFGSPGAPEANSTVPREFKVVFAPHRMLGAIPALSNLQQPNIRIIVRLLLKTRSLTLGTV
jgi:hypothetical protein